MNKTRVAIGVILALAGTVWAFQGLDVSFVPQGAMTGDTLWVVLGGLALLVGLWLIWSGRKRQGSDEPDRQ